MEATSNQQTHLLFNLTRKCLFFSGDFHLFFVKQILLENAEFAYFVYSLI